MYDAVQLENFETELLARWSALPMVPADCDLKRHLAELRSISDVRAKRQAANEAVDPVSDKL